MVAVLHELWLTAACGALVAGATLRLADMFCHTCVWCAPEQNVHRMKN